MRIGLRLALPFFFVSKGNAIFVRVYIGGKRSKLFSKIEREREGKEDQHRAQENRGATPERKK